MALWDKLFGKKTKTLSELSRAELRKEEILLSRERDRIFKDMERIADQKKKIFEMGAQQKSPDVRKALALDFELKSQEQLMKARQLNLRTKELMTVSRLRMIQENREKGSTAGRLNIGERDFVAIEQLIENDSITQEMYQEKLDALLGLGAAADKDAVERAGLTGAGQELMNLWEKMDGGDVKEEQAFEEADRAVRRRQARPEGESF